MSLINDVLRDLERRRAPESVAVPCGARQPDPARRRARHWPLWLLAALAFGAILHLSLGSDSASRESVEPRALTAQASPALEPNPEPVSETAPARPEERATPAAEQSTALAEVAQSTGVAAPPPAATPDGNTDPEQESAASPEQPHRDSAMAAVRQMADSAAPRKPDEKPDRKPDPQPAPAPEANILIRRANSGAAEADPLTAARRMLARGQFQRAESRLRELTEAQPALSETYELLAGTLMHRGRHDDAVRVLESGLEQARDPAPVAALLGRLLLERGEIARARSVLKTHAPGLAEDPDYHLLLAAVQRQAGDHAAAAEHYRELTSVLPRSGPAWVGLGASLESLKQTKEAASAYQRALDGDDERAARFARQRLNTLAPVTGEPPGEASGEIPGETQ